MIVPVSDPQLVFRPLLIAGKILPLRASKSISRGQGRRNGSEPGLRPSPYSVFLHESCRYPLYCGVAENCWSAFCRQCAKPVGCGGFIFEGIQTPGKRLLVHVAACNMGLLRNLIGIGPPRCLQGAVPRPRFAP